MQTAVYYACVFKTPLEQHIKRAADVFLCFRLLFLDYYGACVEENPKIVYSRQRGADVFSHLSLYLTRLSATTPHIAFATSLHL